MNPTYQNQLLLRLRILQLVSHIITTAVALCLEKLEQYPDCDREAKWMHQLMTGHPNSLYDIT